MATKRRTASLPGVLFVLALHGALFYILWSQKLIPLPKQAAIFVNIIATPKPQEEPKPEPPRSTPKPEPVFRLSSKPQPIKQQKQQQVVAEAPVFSQNEPVASPPPHEPEPERIEGPAAPSGPISLAPVILSSELSLTCSKLNAPSYPPLSRQRGEEGKVMLRVELDETGRVSLAQVINSSGYKHLDEAALSAIKTWHCNPPRRNGQPVRAIAMQPFNFILPGD
ncbi:MAG: TonB family protein [Candidatus Nitrotoga sp.]|nr:TonB family protein [Candidatus Nitrotoga sp.]MDO9447840.1 TonB family protein [Candidatus Nitrotoga sp.]MDP3496198.1 TonB family protein [Candidatus Nitrotoga sp.]